MKKCILFVFCSLVVCRAYSQSVNYIRYFQTKCDAEISICRSNYDTALSYYKTIIASPYSPLSKEIHNALLCALIMADTVYIQDTLARYISQINVYEIIKKRDMFPSISDGFWNEFVRRYGNQKFAYCNEINTEYLTKLDSLNLIDQIPRHKKHPLRIKNPKKRELEIRKWVITDSIVALGLDTLIAKWGYPSERVIGLKYSMKSPISIWHRMDSGFRKIEYEALLSGDLNPELYAQKQAYIQEVSIKSNINIDIIDYGEASFIYPLDPSEINRIDYNRNKIGLSSIEETKEIHNYATTNNKYGFKFYINFFHKW